MRRRKAFCVLCAFLRPCTGFVPVLVLLIFGGALFWAKAQDPFSRRWFTVKTTDGDSVKCVAVLPKPVRPRPVIIYAHGSGGSLMNDGFDLRQMAELGMAVVSLEYNQTNEAAFAEQFQAVLRYLGRQKWADTNAVAWIGFSMGANRMLDFALQHPERQPQLLVQLGGAGLPEAALTMNPAPSSRPSPPVGEKVSAERMRIGEGITNLQCSVLLIHGEQDEIFPAADTKRLASILQTNGVPVELKIISSASHGLGADRGVVFRGIGEYCRTHFGGKQALQDYHSIAQWQTEAPPLWLFWLPGAAWAGGWLAWWKFGRRGSIALPKAPLKRHETILRWLAVFLATWALIETALHLVPPRLPVSERTLDIARRFLVQPKERTDFEFLAAHPIWQGEKLKALLTHVELAGYNRELINWKLDDTIYRDHVLSPVITRETGEQLNWRRPLWEEFYPRIRRESSPEDAAKIVVRHLRERVTIAHLPNASHEVPGIWLKQITDEAGFEIIYVAALRSVGVPARLDANRHAEFHDGNKWLVAPSPSVVSW
jgi:acetyl esterase/lipase